MEININCDLGEKSKLHNNENDPFLLGIVNSANVACGYHAGDEETMDQVIKISKDNNVSVGAHPSFNDPDNFGRKRMNLSSSEIKKLIIDQYEILQRIAFNHNENVTHIKPFYVRSIKSFIFFKRYFFHRIGITFCLSRNYYNITLV